MNDYPLVEIEWIDHSGDSNDWHSIEEAKKWTLSPYRIVGYLIAEHEDRYIITFAVADEERDQCLGIMAIAKPQITAIHYLNRLKETVKPHHGE